MRASSRTTRMRTARRLTAVAAAAALPLLSACATFSPATTMVPYNAGDGRSVELGTLKAQNLVVIGSEKGGEAVLSGALVNSGADPVTVAISSEGAPAPVTIDVPPQRMVKLTADGTAPTAGSVDSAATVLLPSLSQPPGSVVTVQLATRAGGQVQVQLPVLLPRYEYATITPPPTTPSPTQSPTGEPAPSGDESAEPTTSPS
jgi:hypothetical protein